MKIPVYIETIASKHIGYVHIENPEDFEESAMNLWESQNFDHPTLCHYCANMDLGDWEISKDNDLDYYFKKSEKDD